MIPLQIFEKHPTADAYRVGGFYSPYALVSEDKRFTEAELAASFWQASYDFECADGDFLTGEAGYHWTENQKGEAKELVIERREFLRFANRPHAHEADYQ